MALVYADRSELLGRPYFHIQGNLDASLMQTWTYEGQAAILLTICDADDHDILFMVDVDCKKIFKALCTSFDDHVLNECLIRQMQSWLRAAESFPW